MQLYSIPISPYASRCRVQIYHKALPVEIVAPPGGLRSAEVLAQNPSGRIPVLITEGGALAESWAIMEYLEDLHPEPAMRPADALARAQQRALVRFADLYLAPAMFPLFQALRGGADANAITKAREGLSGQLEVLERLLAKRDPGELDLGDAALLPIVWYAQILARHFGDADCLSGRDATRAWWARSSGTGAAARVVEELDAGLRVAIPPLFAD